MSVIIRPASIDELSNRSYLEEFYAGENRNIDFEQSVMKGLYHALGTFSLMYASGLFLDNKIIGLSLGIGPEDYADLFSEAKEVFVCSGLEVLPQYRHQGFAKLLVQDKLSFANDNGFSHAVMQTTNAAVKKLYDLPGSQQNQKNGVTTMCIPTKSYLHPTKELQINKMGKEHGN